MQLMPFLFQDDSFRVFPNIAPPPPHEIIAPPPLWYNYLFFWGGGAIGYLTTNLGWGYNGKDPSFLTER